MKIVIAMFFLIAITVFNEQPAIIDVDKDIVEIIAIELAKGEEKVYFQTITEDQHAISGWIFSSVLNSTLCTSKEEQFSCIISDDELEELKEGFENRTSLKINEVSGGKRIRTHHKKKWETGEWISSPVLIREGTLALLYRNGIEGSGFIFYKKAEGVWKSVCYAAVRISC